MPSAAVALKYLVKVFGDLTISKFFVICAELTINNGLCAYFIIESLNSHIPEVPGSTPGYPNVISP